MFVHFVSSIKKTCKNKFVPYSYAMLPIPKQNMIRHSIDYDLDICILYIYINVVLKRYIYLLFMIITRARTRSVNFFLRNGDQRAGKPYTSFQPIRSLPQRYSCRLAVLYSHQDKHSHQISLINIWQRVWLFQFLVWFACTFIGMVS